MGVDVLLEEYSTVSAVQYQSGSTSHEHQFEHATGVGTPLQNVHAATFGKRIPPLLGTGYRCHSMAEATSGCRHGDQSGRGLAGSSYRRSRWTRSGHPAGFGQQFISEFRHPLFIETAKRNPVRSVDSAQTRTVSGIDHLSRAVVPKRFWRKRSPSTHAELVIEQLIVPVMVEIGQRWHDDDTQYNRRALCQQLSNPTSHCASTSWNEHHDRAGHLDRHRTQASIMKSGHCC